MPVFCILCTELRRPGWPNFLRQHSFEIYREACKFQGAFTPNVQVTTASTNITLCKAEKCIG